MSKVLPSEEADIQIGGHSERDVHFQDIEANTTKSMQSPEMSPGSHTPPLSPNPAFNSSSGVSRQSLSNRSMKRHFKEDGELIIELFIQLGERRPLSTHVPTCNVTLSEVSAKDLQAVASGLHFFLATEASEENAVTKFLKHYPSMKELEEKYSNFEEGLLMYCSRLLSDQSKFAKAKLFAVAALSIGDMFTDILMIFEYFKSGDDKYGWAALACVLVNLSCTSILTYLNNRALTKRKQLKEQFFVWTLIKPGVNAWRVANNSEHEEGHIMHALNELSFDKGIELISEAIPGSVIQLAAIMNAGISNTSRNAAFSFAFSVFTSAFTSAMLSWDWDNNKEQRRLVPWFYGYIPSKLSSKIIVAMSLYCLAMSNLITRSFSCVVLYLSGGVSTAFMVLGAELCLYLVIKTARQDFWYWLPVYGAPGLFISLMVRVMAKLLADWTAVVQFRHPLDVGGAYFTSSLALTIAIGMWTALRYDKEVVEKEEAAMDNATVVKLMASMCAGIFVSYSVFLANINKNYLHTFFSLKTGNEQTRSLFTDNEEDERRFKILTKNKHLWKARIGKEVEEWLNLRLPLWLDEELDWFNEQKMSMIEEEMIHDAEVKRRVMTKNVKGIIEERRNSSVIGAFVDARVGMGVDKVKEENDGDGRIQPL